MDYQTLIQVGFAVIGCVALAKYVAKLVSDFRIDAMAREDRLARRIDSIEDEYRTTLTKLVTDCTNTNKALLRELRARPCLAQSDLETAIMSNKGDHA